MLGQTPLVSNFAKSHAFDFKQGAAIEKDIDGNQAPSRYGDTVKVQPPRAPKVIRGHSPYGNFLADEMEPFDRKATRSMSSLGQASTDSFYDGAGRESSLSMVSDYTLSYGTDALEPQQLVQNGDGRFVPAYVALDRKVLRFHAWFRDPRGAVGFKVRKATLFHVSLHVPTTEYCKLFLVRARVRMGKWHRLMARPF